MGLLDQWAEGIGDGTLRAFSAHRALVGAPESLALSHLKEYQLQSVCSSAKKGDKIHETTDTKDCVFH